MSEYDDAVMDYDPTEDEPEMVAVHGTCLHITEKAVLMDIDGEEHWFPKSQCGGFKAGKPHDPLTLWVPNWLLERKGLEDHIDSDEA